MVHWYRARRDVFRLHAVSRRVREQDRQTQLFLQQQFVAELGSRNPPAPSWSEHVRLGRIIVVGRSGVVAHHSVVRSDR